MAVHWTVAIAFSVLLPGMGLVYLGWLRTGMVVGVLFAGAVSGLFWLTLLAPARGPDWAPGVLGGLAAGLGAVSVGATGYVVARRRPTASAPARDRLFREGLTAYLRGEYGRAEGTFRSIIRLHRGDVEAHLKLAMVHKARGRRAEAVAALRRCRYYDADGTWRWEVERELAAFEHREDGA